MQKRRDENSVRVSNLSEDVTEDDLADLFGPFGPIQRIFVAKDRETGGWGWAAGGRALQLGWAGRKARPTGPWRGCVLPSPAGRSRPRLHPCGPSVQCATAARLLMLPAPGCLPRACACVCRRRKPRLCLHQLHPPRGRPARHLQAGRLRLRQPHPLRLHGCPASGAAVGLAPGAWRRGSNGGGGRQIVCYPRATPCLHADGGSYAPVSTVLVVKQRWMAKSVNRRLTRLPRRLYCCTWGLLLEGPNLLASRHRSRLPPQYSAPRGALPAHQPQESSAGACRLASCPDCPCTPARGLSCPCRAAHRREGPFQGCRRSG